MIIDTSALVAISADEPECDAFTEAIARNGGCRMSAAAYLEAGIVLDLRNSPILSRQLDALIAQLGITIVPFTPAQAEIARAAYLDYGRGSGSRAKLNFGDCISYALAIDTDEPLLFKGDGFIHTDVRRAKIPGF